MSYDKYMYDPYLISLTSPLHLYSYATVKHHDFQYVVLDWQ